MIQGRQVYAYFPHSAKMCCCLPRITWNSSKKVLTTNSSLIPFFKFLQGKPGEPGLDVSTEYNSFNCVITVLANNTVTIFATVNNFTVWHLRLKGVQGHVT